MAIGAAQRWQVDSHLARKLRLGARRWRGLVMAEEANGDPQPQSARYFLLTTWGATLRCVPEPRQPAGADTAGDGGGTSGTGSPTWRITTGPPTALALALRVRLAAAAFFRLVESSIPMARRLAPSSEEIGLFRLGSFSTGGPAAGDRGPPIRSGHPFWDKGPQNR